MASTNYCVKRLAKYGPVRQNKSGQYWVERDGQRITVMDQAGEAVSIKIRHVGDEDDPLTDYYGGSYVDNITRALRWAGWMP